MTTDDRSNSDQLQDSSERDKKGPKTGGFILEHSPPVSDSMTVQGAQQNGVRVKRKFSNSQLGKRNSIASLVITRELVSNSPASTTAASRTASPLATTSASRDNINNGSENGFHSGIDLHSGISATSPLSTCSSDYSSYLGSPTSISQCSNILSPTLIGKDSFNFLPFHLHSTDTATTTAKFIEFSYGLGEVDFSKEMKLEIIYKYSTLTEADRKAEEILRQFHTRKSGKMQLGAEEGNISTDSFSSTHSNMKLLPAATATVCLTGELQGQENEKIRIDATQDESFTLEPFITLIEACYAANKCFILARVQTMDPIYDTLGKEMMCPKSYYSYYDAQHFNKILFTTQPEKGLLHRMKAKNPLNNMNIIGKVEYFYISPLSIQASIKEFLKATTAFYSGKEKGAVEKAATLTPVFLFQANYLANDEDFLSIVKVREFFRSSSVKPEEHALLTLDQLNPSFYGGGGHRLSIFTRRTSAGRGRPAGPTNDLYLHNSDNSDNDSRPQNQFEHCVGFCGLFNHHSATYRRKWYIFLLMTYITIASIVFLFCVPIALKGIFGTGFMLLLCILIILFLENDRLVSLNREHARIFDV